MHNFHRFRRSSLIFDERARSRIHESYRACATNVINNELHLNGRNVHVQTHFAHRRRIIRIVGNELLILVWRQNAWWHFQGTMRGASRVGGSDREKIEKERIRERESAFPMHAYELADCSEQKYHEPPHILMANIEWTHSESVQKKCKLLDHRVDWSQRNRFACMRNIKINRTCWCS